MPKLPVEVLGSRQKKIINFLMTTARGNNVNPRQSLGNRAARLGTGTVTTRSPDSCRRVPRGPVPCVCVCVPHGRGPVGVCRRLSAMASTSSPSRCGVLPGLAVPVSPPVPLHPLESSLSPTWRGAPRPRPPRGRPGEGAGHRGVSRAVRAEVRAVGPLQGAGGAAAVAAAGPLAEVLAGPALPGTTASRL